MMNVGYNIRLSPLEIRHALRDTAIQKLAKKGRALDSMDAMAFHADAGVFVKLKTPGNEVVSDLVVVIDEVTVTWSE